MTDPYARLAAAAADWDELRPRLDPAALRRLALLLTTLRTETGAAARRRAALLAARLLEERLPDRFPGESRLTAAPDAPDAPAADHLGFTADDLAVLVLDGHRMAGPVLGEVRDRLLAAPALGDAEVLEAGSDPYAPYLIRLPAPGGLIRLPAFQFTAGGRVRPAVREVNLLLGADEDPWGAADWWLSPNAWLAGYPAPVALLDTPDEQRLAGTAAFLAEGE
ncbi:hypothetical protein [Streptomyces sp. NBC_01006]|uniref:hypothetical protein n=1 Tax=Streptomyces sp. NBC_01006 TaxID=2903716 RepID=UPI003862E9BB|nr:hypothetical protein OG509_02045 [Streptomyces sp. NBC_01006]